MSKNNVVHILGFVAAFGVAACEDSRPDPTGSGGKAGAGGEGGAGGGTGGAGGSGGGPVGCSVVLQNGCDAGRVCEEVEGGSPACFAPLTVRGRVVNALTNAALENARVVARDPSEAAISNAVFSMTDGTYSLNVPAKRDFQGNPVSSFITLRVEAAGHQAFPLAPRSPISIDLGMAIGDPPILQVAATTVGLFPLEATAGRGSVAGRVIIDPGVTLVPAGSLVTAGGSSSIVDKKGEFVVYNALAGMAVPVRGFSSGLQFAPASAAIVAGMSTTGVELHLTGSATAKVFGNVQLVNVPGNLMTSAALMLKETFVTSAGWGEVPKGLRVGNISGTFEISDVPNGDYILMAAFDNDQLVRDPDPSLPPSMFEVQVNGQDVTTLSAKVTGALAIVAPGATDIEPIMNAPTFTWGDDAAEDFYQVKLFNALGTMVWETMVPRSTTGMTVSTQYTGPTLIPGMVYRFLVTSNRTFGAISQSEDLRGVFVYTP